MVKFCMFICFKPILQLSKCTVKAILKLVSFKTQIVHDTNNISQYRLGLQIDSLDGNRLSTTEETWHQNL
jgi:hypothetical protein